MIELHPLSEPHPQSLPKPKPFPLPQHEQSKRRMIIQLHPLSPLLHPPHVVAAKSLINPPFVDFIDLIIIYNLRICGVGCLIYKKLKEI